MTEARFATPSEAAERTAKAILDTAFEVYEDLGPGLLERSYALVLARRLQRRGHRVEFEVALAIEVDGERIENAYRIDLRVDREVLVEVKAVAGVAPEHYAQVFTYLRHSKCALGLILNFHSVPLRKGIRRLTRRLTPRELAAEA